MTQRVELAIVMDRLAVDEVITDYAVAVDDGDWEAYRKLFAPDGRADYRSAGGIEGDAGQVAGWLAESMKLFPMRQHLIVNRRIRFGALDQNSDDTARVQADYVNPMRFAKDDEGDRDRLHRPRLRVRRPVRVRAAADVRRLAADRGRRGGEVAAPSRAAPGSRGQLRRPAGRPLSEIVPGTHTGATSG
jgi:hypothetical protein